MAKSEKVEVLTQPKMEPTVYFNFDKDFKAPAAFGSLTIGVDVRFEGNGKVKALSIDPQSVTIEMKRVDLAKAGPRTIAEAKTTARDRVKDFK